MVGRLQLGESKEVKLNLKVYEGLQRTYDMVFEQSGHVPNLLVIHYEADDKDTARKFAQLRGMVFEETHLIDEHLVYMFTVEDGDKEVWKDGK